jgi:hypothetical protein
LQLEPETDEALAVAPLPAGLAEPHLDAVRPRGYASPTIRAAEADEQPEAPLLGGQESEDGFDGQGAGRMCLLDEVVLGPVFREGQVSAAVERGADRAVVFTEFPGQAAP